MNKATPVAIASISPTMINRVLNMRRIYPVARVCKDGKWLKSVGIPPPERACLGRRKGGETRADAFRRAKTARSWAPGEDVEESRAPQGREYFEGKDCLRPGAPLAA